MYAYNVALLIIGFLLIIKFTSLYFQVNYDTVVTFFHRPGCGHCSRMYNDWDEFVLMAPKNINTRKINVQDPKWSDVISNYEIKGVPYIIKEKFGTTTIHQGPRNSSSLMKFAIY